MIRLTAVLPDIQPLSAEFVRIRSLFDVYGKDTDVLFWEQGEGQAFFSLADGDMTVFNPAGDIEETGAFLRMISPKTVFSDAKTLEALGLVPYQKVTVLCRKADEKGQAQGDPLNSREIYELFRAGGLSLPEYPAFAVDLCRRLNHGKALCFGRKELCAAVSVFSGDLALLTGIVSLQKGLGSVALEGILAKNTGRQVLACCEEAVRPFYLKHGFRILYEAGSWSHEHGKFFLDRSPADADG